MLQYLEKKVIKGENENGPKVGILDLGVKQNIVRNLIKDLEKLLYILCQQILMNNLYLKWM